MTVTVSDVEVRYGRPFHADQIPQVEAFVMDATAMVQNFCGSGYDPNNPTIDAVICAEVIRWLEISPGIVSEKVGDFEVNFGASSSTQFLSPPARVALRRFRRKLVSVPLVVCDVDPVLPPPAFPGNPGVRK